MNNGAEVYLRVAIWNKVTISTLLFGMSKSFISADEFKGISSRISTNDPVWKATT